jgi:hypothetical protein
VDNPVRLPSLALFGLVAFALAACGGGAGDEAEIKAMVEASATSRNPMDCRRHGTMNMLERSFKVQGRAAVRACEESKLEARDLPTAVEVTRIEIDGANATARVDSVDGPYDEQEAVIALVKENGSWKEDEVLEFAVFDREAFVLEFGRDVMEEAHTPAQAQASACMIGQLEGLDDAALEALLLDPSPQPILDLARPCEPRSTSV